MELYEDILSFLLRSQRIEICFPDLKDKGDVIEGICYCTLKKIKAVLEDDLLDDKECFEKIEEIVNLFEEIGSDCGSRHDFG